MRKNYIVIIFTFLLALTVFIPNSINAEGDNAVKINQIEYETLALGVESAKEGETITLLKDIEVTSADGFIANLPTNSTLDLNGHTITIDFMALIFTGNNITIKNGNFNTVEAYSLWIGDEAETKGAIIDNVKTNGGINIYNATDVVIRNTTAIGHTYYSVWVDNGANATVESGNYSTQGSNGLVGVSKDNDFEHALSIVGGTFIANNNIFAVGSPCIPPEVSGGKFNMDVSKYLIEGYKCELSNEYYIVGKIKCEQEVELMPTDIGKDENKITIEVPNNAEAKNTLLESLNTSDNINVSNKDVKVVIDINHINVDKSVEQSITQKLTNICGDINIAEYLDISLNVIDTDTNLLIGNLSNLNKKIKLNVVLSKELKNIKDGYKRAYYIARKHGNDIEILDAVLSEDGNYISFETDKFSTYALVYVDEVIETNNVNNISNNNENTNDIENPETGDENINIYIILGFLSLICILYISKRKIFN